MSISSVSGNSAWTQIQQFQSGKTKLQKEDLQQLQQQTAPDQTQGASPFDELLAAFDEIDTNQDGISIDELQSYAAENGMAEGGRKAPPSGPPPSMMGELGQKPPQGGPGGPGGPGGMPESVSKEELMAIQSDMESQGMEVPEKLSELISNFDSLDTDQDGKVSIEEMMAGEEQEAESSETASVESQKLDFLKLIEKYASEDEESATTNTDESKDLAIKFMRAINQYSNFASYSSQNSGSSMFELAA